MSYDKPKVTIDLDEYEELRKRSKELENKDDEAEKVLYKKAIMAVLVGAGQGMSGFDNSMFVTRELAKVGISIEVLRNAGIYGPGEEYKALRVYELKDRKNAQ